MGYDKDRRRKVIEELMSGVSIGEVRDKFGACIGCMRQPGDGHTSGCLLNTPIDDYVTTRLIGSTTTAVTQGQTPIPIYTAEDLHNWIAEYIERRDEHHGPQTLQQIYERTEHDLALKSRVKTFLHRVDGFGVAIANELDNHRGRLLVYHLVKSWVSTLVGWDAPKTEYVEGGFDVLMRWAIERLKV